MTLKIVFFFFFIFAYSHFFATALVKLAVHLFKCDLYRKSRRDQKITYFGKEIYVFVEHVNYFGYYCFIFSCRVIAT